MSMATALLRTLRKRKARQNLPKALPPTSGATQTMRPLSKSGHQGVELLFSPQGSGLFRLLIALFRKQKLHLRAVANLRRERGSSDNVQH
jgi:hypothetical protein